MQQRMPIKFIPNPSSSYKIISVLNPKQIFTLNPNNHKLVLYNDSEQSTQMFKILQVNDKYLFVNNKSNQALRVDKQNKGDGSFIRSELGHFQSNYFQISPVGKGQWVGKAYHIGTFTYGKVLDIKGGQANQNCDICQWPFDGQLSQQWIIIPSKEVFQDKPQARQGQFRDVPAYFEPRSSTRYKIIPLLDQSKCLTVGYDNKVHITRYDNRKEQQFSVHCQKGKNKYAFICSENNSRLYLYKDSMDNQVDIITTQGNHVSNWFDIVPVQKGKYMKKAYVIITHARDKCLDIRNGRFQEGQIIHQFSIKESDSQLWLIEPINEDQPYKYV